MTPKVAVEAEVPEQLEQQESLPSNLSLPALDEIIEEQKNKDQHPHYAPELKRRFLCYKCAAEFTMRTNLTRHIKRMHD
jgi:hypothetical protein